MKDERPSGKTSVEREETGSRLRVIQTRYRDIPFEEAAKWQGNVNPEYREIWETQMRGKEILISAIPTDSYICKCCAVYFPVLGKARPYLVCPHIAEIGD